MLKRVIVAGLAALVSACVSPYVATPYDRSAYSVERIAVMPDSVPPEPIALEVASAGSNFGLIGALVDAGIQASRQDAIKDALEAEGFDPQAVMERRIATALQGHGYDVSIHPGPDRQRREFMVAYPTADGTRDAYLDLVLVHYGYLSAGAFQPFRPSVEARVRLVSAADPTAVLMENLIVYNTMYPQEGVIVLTPNPAYAFQNREEMLADPTRLAEGIEVALNEVADTAARLLQ